MALARGRKKTEKFAAKVMELVNEYGFLYISNHGIPEEQMNDINSMGREFFDLPLEIKDKYHRKKPHGYSRYQEEIYDLDKAEHKECFDIYPSFADKWPAEVENFKERSQKFMAACASLLNRLLKLLATGIGVKPEDLFADCDTNPEINYTNARFLVYPPLKREPEPGEVRLAEHTDYGLMSIIFQDDTGGLEMKLPSGEWIEAVPVPGTILIVISEILETATSGKLKATLHRVPYPKHGNVREARRFSSAFFLHPPKDTLVLQKGSDAPPQKAGDIFKKRYDKTYEFVEY